MLEARKKMLEESLEVRTPTTVAKICTDPRKRKSYEQTQEQEAVTTTTGHARRRGGWDQGGPEALPRHDARAHAPGSLRYRRAFFHLAFPRRT